MSEDKVYFDSTVLVRTSFFLIHNKVPESWGGLPCFNERRNVKIGSWSLRGVGSCSTCWSVSVSSLSGKDTVSKRSSPLVQPLLSNLCVHPSNWSRWSVYSARSRSSPSSNFTIYPRLVLFSRPRFHKHSFPLGELYKRLWSPLVVLSHWS